MFALILNKKRRFRLISKAAFCHACNRRIGVILYLPVKRIYNKTQEVLTMANIYETAGGTYQRQGDYKLPNLKLLS